MSIDRNALLRAVDAGLISRRVKGDLAIYNYTPRCAFERSWKPETLAARGLILHEPTGIVVARPFEKFFNIAEIPETAMDSLPWGDPHEVHEKLDGSLGIVYHWDGRWDVATRGAFDSDQAVYAREHLLPMLRLSAVPTGLTILCEIIYPENRIVVDYGDREELVVIAARETVSGKWMDRFELSWLCGSLAAEMARYVSSRAITDGEHATNTEGVVVFWPGSGLRVKVKSPDYVAAHRMLEYRSPRRVLELIAESRYDDVASLAPRHVRESMDQIAEGLISRVGWLMLESARLHGLSAHLLSADGGRKAYAAEACRQDPPIRALMFSRAGGKDDDVLFKQACEMVKRTLAAEEIATDV